MATRAGESRDNRKNPSSLCHLSNEILCLIAAFLPNPSDLYSIARTCKLLHENATPILYKSVLIKDEIRFRQFATGRIRCGPRLLEHIHNFDLSMWLYRSYERQFETIKCVGDMVNLKHLSIEYHSVAEMPAFALLPMHLPETLSCHLVSCILKWTPGNFWDLKTAIHIFEHPTLRKLELHSARSWDTPRSGPLDAMSTFLRSSGSGKFGVTSLETLNLVGCKINAADLQQLLRYPRSLRFLSICPNHVDSRSPLVRLHDLDTFNSILTSKSGKSIAGFRYDTSQGNFRRMVPAPGMYKLVSVRYLDIEHELLAPSLATSISLMRDIIPPKLEVLKIFNYKDKNDNTIYEILRNKRAFFLALRRIILVLHYRNAAMAEELRIAARAEMKHRSRLHYIVYGHTMSVAIGLPIQEYPVQEEKMTLNKLSAACQAQGVKLTLFYEDSARREILKEGAGPAVWEIPEQIA